MTTTRTSSIPVPMVNNHRISRRARAFTFVELCMGLVITSLVMSAVAALSMAMATAWRSAGKTQSLTLKGNFISRHVQNEVRNARLIGACRAGTSDGTGTGAAVLLWKTDTNSDGYIQGNECELIAHDTTNHTLILYPSGTADGAGTWSYSGTFTASASLDQFIINRPSKVIAHGVYGAIFQTSGTSGTTNNPVFKFALKMMSDDSQIATGNGGGIGGAGQLLMEYGGAAVRAPLAAPAN